jgi:hypothetical protein
MPRVRLIHWSAAEARERALVRERLGYEVAAGPLDAATFAELKRDPPDAFVIDLSRLPSQGREVGAGLRCATATRRVPLVFVEGDPAKVQGVRKLLPDATFATYRGIEGALRRALARRDTEPVVPASTLAAYAGTPLPKKLGIRPGSAVCLAGAPKGFEKTLGRMPAGVTIARRLGARSDLVLWFVRSRRDLERGLPRMIPRAARGGLWIAWPKRVSGASSDLTQAGVRAAGLAAGLVDFKIAAIDETWSGLRFTRKAG